MKDYDYSKEGFYYITICTYNREETLSKIIKKDVGAGFHPCPKIETKYSNIGKIVENSIKYINMNHKNIAIGDYVIMPNHIHMIVRICNKGGGGTPPLQRIIGKFKLYTTTLYNQIENTRNKKMW